MENILTYKQTVKVINDTRSIKDNRVKVDRVVCEYTDSGGEIYRKSFETKVNADTLIIPQQGTHERLNQLKHQF